MKMFFSFLHIQLYVQSSLKIIVLISVPFDVFSINSSQETVAFSPFFFFLDSLFALQETFSQNISSAVKSPPPPNLMTNFNKPALIHPPHTHTPACLTCLSLHGVRKDKKGLKMKYSDKLASLSLSWVGLLSYSRSDLAFSPHS